MEMIEELEERMDEADKKVQTMLEKMQAEIKAAQELIEKKSNENGKAVTTLQEQLEEMKEQIEDLEEDVADGGGNAEGGNDGKVSNLQRKFNENVEKRIIELERETQRLQRVDFKLNNELVRKPYAYIDKVKEQLINEQNEMRRIVQANNDKYMSKIGNTDIKVSRVLTETQGLINSYQKKIGLITKNVEKTNVIKEELRYRQKQSEDKLSLIEK